MHHRSNCVRPEDSRDASAPLTVLCSSTGKPGSVVYVARRDSSLLLRLLHELAIYSAGRIRFLRQYSADNAR